MVLLGIVPVFVHTPPTPTPFSTMATRLPDFAAWIAARWPPGPEPITTKSYACIWGILRGGFGRGVIGGGAACRISIDRPIDLAPGLVECGRGMLRCAHQLFLHRNSAAVTACARQ